MTLHGRSEIGVAHKGRSQRGEGSLAKCGQRTGVKDFRKLILFLFFQYVLPTLSMGVYA